MRVFGDLLDFGERARAETREADPQKRVLKMKARPNWESDDYVGVGQDGAVHGHFAATGVRPRCWERLQSRGIRLCKWPHSSPCIIVSYFLVAIGNVQCCL